MGDRVPYLELFLTFLRIGFMLFGGLYGGPAIYYKVLVEERGWLTEEELLSRFGVSQGIPGPVLVSATVQIGYVLGGVAGSVIALAGVLLPPFTLALGAAALLGAYMNHWVARALLRGVNAAVLALVLYSLYSLSRSILFRSGAPDYVSMALFATLSALLLAARTDILVVIVLGALASLLARALLGI